MRMIVALIALFAGAPALVRAQPAATVWPTKTVRIVAPFAAGSTPDIVARLLADHYAKAFPASTFLVDNKPGASGNLGTDIVAKADPDGSVIGVSIGGPLAINTILFKRLNYNPAKDIAAVTQLVTQPSVLVVNAKLGVNNVSELIEILKKNPGQYTYGSIGVGSLSQLAMEAIAQSSGTKIVHVPLQGSPAAMMEVIRGDVQMACLPSIAVTPQAKSGQIKILAVSTAKRSPFLPDAPTLMESGVNVQADAWMGLIAPAGTPQAVIQRIHDATVDALASADVKEKLAAQQMEPVGNTPAQFRAVIDAEVARWAPVIKAANISVD